MHFFSLKTLLFTLWNLKLSWLFSRYLVVYVCTTEDKHFWCRAEKPAKYRNRHHPGAQIPVSKVIYIRFNLYTFENEGLELHGACGFSSSLLLWFWVLILWSQRIQVLLWTISNKTYRLKATLLFAANNILHLTFVMNLRW